MQNSSEPPAHAEFAQPEVQFDSPRDSNFENTSDPPDSYPRRGENSLAALQPRPFNLRKPDFARREFPVAGAKKGGQKRAAGAVQVRRRGAGGLHECAGLLLDPAGRLIAPPGGAFLPARASGKRAATSIRFACARAGSRASTQSRAPFFARRLALDAPQLAAREPRRTRSRVPAYWLFYDCGGAPWSPAPPLGIVLARAELFLADAWGNGGCFSVLSLVLELFLRRRCIVAYFCGEVFLGLPIYSRF